jgi:transcriptional regulator of acetoin/glycerol metabolism
MAQSLLGGTLLPELVRHGWPGNVRELRNYLEGALARQDATLVPSEHEPSLDLALPLRVVRDRYVRHIERRYLEALLTAHGGNVSAAARAAGIDRVHLHRLLKSTGLR